MASTDLKLDEPGTLPRPGPIGRMARLVLGGLCLWFVIGLVEIHDSMLDSQGSIRSLVWNGVLPGLFLISYVVNIGFSRAWKKWPAAVSIIVLSAFAALAYMHEGSIETAYLARAIWLWELYVFAHLGLAFLLSGLIATPGCEMRAFHDLYSRLTGRPTKEHFCPVGPLHPIDQWESQRRQD